jgi:hypothetical protein
VEDKEPCLQNTGVHADASDAILALSESSKRVKSNSINCSSENQNSQISKDVSQDITNEKTNPFFTLFII